MNNSSSNNCAEIEQILRNPAYSIVMLFHLALLTATLAGIFVLIWQYRRRQQRVLLHGNLLVLFGNIVLLYFIHTISWLFCLIRYQILLHTMTNPCDLLTPIWMVLCIYAPYYIYSMAYPAFHFCIMIERLRATIRAEKYENEKRKMGIRMAIGIWSLSGFYFVYIAFSAMADSDAFGQPQGGIYMTTKYNAQPIFLMTTFTLCLMLVTAAVDWRVSKMNKRIRHISTKSSEYSLSRNYQVNENALAMRMILPLDLSYAALYTVYIAIVILIRAKKPFLTIPQYCIYFNSTDTLLFLHSAITVVVYIHFIKFATRTRKMDSSTKLASEQSKMHFKQLSELWQ